MFRRKITFAFLGKNLSFSWSFLVISGNIFHFFEISGNIFHFFEISIFLVILQKGTKFSGNQAQFQNKNGFVFQNMPMKVKLNDRLNKIYLPHWKRLLQYIFWWEHLSRHRSVAPVLLRVHNLAIHYKYNYFLTKYRRIRSGTLTIGR